MLIDSSSRNQWNFDGEVIILGNTSFVSSKVFLFLQLHCCELYNHIPSKWDYSALSISILLTCLDLSIYYIATGLIKRIVLSKSSLSGKGPHEYENFELSLGWFRNFFFWLNRLLITTNNHLSFSTKKNNNVCKRQQRSMRWLWQLTDLFATASLQAIEPNCHGF